jgi:hypothetical protein
MTQDPCRLPSDASCCEPCGQSAATAMQHSSPRRATTLYPVPPNVKPNGRSRGAREDKATRAGPPPPGFGRRRRQRGAPRRACGGALAARGSGNAVGVPWQCWSWERNAVGVWNSICAPDAHPGRRWGSQALHPSHVSTTARRLGRGREGGATRPIQVRPLPSCTTTKRYNRSWACYSPI